MMTFLTLSLGGLGLALVGGLSFFYGFSKSWDVAMEELHRRWEPIVRVVENDRGGWSLLLPSIGRMIGNYASAEDARRAAERSGYLMEEN